MTLALKDPSLLRQQCLINGEWRAATANAGIDVINPATGAKIATVPNMGAEETKQAIQFAEIAQKNGSRKLLVSAQKSCSGGIA